MHRVPTFSRTPLRQLLLRTATVVILSAAATAHATNYAVYITGSNAQCCAIAGRHYTFTPQVTNPSGRTLTFGIVNKPSWAAFNTSTGQLSGTPPNVLRYYNGISISVTNGENRQDTLFPHPRVCVEHFGQARALGQTPHQCDLGHPLCISTRGPRPVQPAAVLFSEK